MERATYFCVDIECSGPVPAIFDMLSLGACVVRPGEEGLELGGTFYVELKPVTGREEPGTAAIHGLSIAELREHGERRAAALDSLERFVEQETVEGTSPVFVGHNAPFDWSFVAHACAAEGRQNPFGYKALDTKALSAGVLGLHWFDTDKPTLARRLGLPDEDRSQKHRADYDAWYQALILKALLERQRRD